MKPETVTEYPKIKVPGVKLLRKICGNKSFLNINFFPCDWFGSEVLSKVLAFDLVHLGSGLIGGMKSYHPMESKN